MNPGFSLAESWESSKSLESANEKPGFILPNSLIYLSIVLESVLGQNKARIGWNFECYQFFLLVKPWGNRVGVGPVNWGVVYYKSSCEAFCLLWWIFTSFWKSPFLTLSRTLPGYPADTARDYWLRSIPGKLQLAGWVSDILQVTASSSNISQFILRHTHNRQ